MGEGLIVSDLESSELRDLRACFTGGEKVVAEEEQCEEPSQ